jgi:hypothetical protein
MAKYASCKIINFLEICCASNLSSARRDHILGYLHNGQTKLSGNAFLQYEDQGRDSPNS